MNEQELNVFILAVFSATYLIASEDGEISPQETQAFIDVLKERHDLEIDPEGLQESFQESFDVDEGEHLSRISRAAGLSETLRRQILSVALAVAAVDGGIPLSEILCLPDVASALDIELPDIEVDEGGASGSFEEEDDETAQPSEEAEASLRHAEAALRAEGNTDPSSADIAHRAAIDVVSRSAANLKAFIVQRQGFAAWEAGDYEAAYGFYLEAAEAGDKDAMYNLGQMYQAGEWVDVDLDEALGWWQRAAAKGQLMAQQNAWVTFWQRDDLKSALEYAGMAAAQGDEESTRFVREQTLSRAPDSDGTGFDEITDYARARQPQRSSVKTTHQLARAIDLIDPDLPMVSGDQGGAPEEWRTRAAALTLQEASKNLRYLSGSPLFTLTDEVFASFSPDGTKILSWGCAPEDYTLSVWASETGNRQLKIDLEERFKFAAFSFDGTKIISHTDNGDLNDGFRIWDAETAELLRHVNNGTTYCELVVSPSTPHLIALGDSFDFAHLYNYDTGDLLLDLRLQNTAWPDAAFSSDGSSFLISQPGEQPILVYDSSTTKEKWRLASEYKSAALNTDGSLIAALSVETIDLLDGFSGHKIRTLSYSARRAAFSPDGQHLYAVSGSSEAVSEAEVRVWNVATGILLHTFPASGLAFGPAASQIMTFEGSVARVRDMMNGAVVREFDNGDRIHTGQFRPDGKLAAICSYSLETRRTSYGSVSSAFANTDVWDLTGRPPPSELTPFGHEALFLISQALAFLTAPPLEGATPGERMMRTLMVPIDQRRLTTVLQSECDLWPAGEEEVFKSLLGLRERIGRIQQEQDHVISGAVAEDADYRQRLATQILSGLVESIRILKISAGSDKARHRVDELIKRVAPLVSPEENALLLGLSSALDVGLADPSGRLVKFIDTPAGQKMQNERLRDWANTLDRTKGALSELEVRAAPEEATPEPLTRGFWARLFGWGRRP